MGARDQLQFDEATHVYRLGPVIVPGVTSILRPLIDFSGVPPDVLARKADLGRRVHLACQLDDEDDLDETTVEDEVAPYLCAYRQFREDTRAVVVANEQRVFHPLYRYAGTLDRKFDIPGLGRVLTDLKTSFTTPLSTGPQTAAYQAADADPSVTGRAALRLRADGTYRFERLIDPDDWSVFMACLSLQRFKEKHGV